MTTDEKNKLMNTMALNLPILRSKLDLSQEDLSELIGLSRQTISSFESGTRFMTWSAFLALVLIFFRNEPTKRLLVALNVYTPLLDDFINVSQNFNKER